MPKVSRLHLGKGGEASYDDRAMVRFKKWAVAMDLEFLAHFENLKPSILRVDHLDI